MCRPSVLAPVVVALGAAAAAVPAPAAHARAGDLDRTFADHGHFTRWVSDENPWSWPSDAWAGPDGSLLVQLERPGLGFARLTRGGRVDRGYGVRGFTRASGEADVARPIGGGRLVVGVGEFNPWSTPQVLGPDGRTDPFNGPLLSALRAPGPNRARTQLALGGGRLLDLVASRRSGQPWTIRTLKLDGTVAQSARTRVTRPEDYVYVDEPDPVRSGNGVVLVGRVGDFDHTVLVRLRLDGRLDRRWSGDGRLPSRAGSLRLITQLLRWRDGGIVAVAASDRRVALTWIDRRGRLVRSRSVRGTIAGSDGHGRVLVAGNPGGDHHTTILRRLRGDGRVDRTFGRAGRVVLRTRRNAAPRRIVVQPDGGILLVAVAQNRELFRDREDYYDFDAHGTFVWRLHGR